jgi:hypothetical protein
MPFIIMYMRGLLTTCFVLKGPSSGNTYIKNYKKSSPVLCGLYVNEISFLQLISLHWRVIGVYIDVVYIVDFVENSWENICCLSNSFILTLLSTKSTIETTSVHTPITLQCKPSKCKNEMSFMYNPLITQ